MIAEHTTSRVAELAFLPASGISARALALARLSLFDWGVVACAGAREPLSRIVRGLVLNEGGTGVATLVGSAVRVPSRAAALANGTISHALDYDDTHFAHVGHLSVAIMPAALAAGEATGASAQAILEAFVLGAEAACRIGVVLGRAHYERGFHQTATAGSFGATVAAGRLLGLAPPEMRHALGLASTRASGLKSQFGTMGKPLNAGIAASNGVEAAALALRGLTSCDDGLGGVQGFVDTHAEIAFETEAWAEPPPERFLFEDNKYKLHACCHGTHAMIDALAGARSAGLDPGRVTNVALRTNPRWMRVCDVKQPRTGLEAKFSYGLLAAMALANRNTASDASYTDALCGDPVLQEIARRVTVEADPVVSDTAADLTVTLDDGQTITLRRDLADPVPLADLEAGLRAKASALLGDAIADRLWAGASEPDRGSLRPFADVLASVPG